MGGLIEKPAEFVRVYIDAIGAVAVAIVDIGADYPRAADDIIITPRPWARLCTAAYWYATGAAAMRARKLLTPQYLANCDPDDIVRHIFRTAGIRCIPHGTLCAMARATIEEIDRTLADGHRDINRQYRDYHRAMRREGRRARPYEWFKAELKKQLIRRALAKKI